MSEKKIDSIITISDLWHLCAVRWKWFVVSVCVCLFIAVYYILTAPYLYTRTASIMVREESLGKNTSEANANEFSDIGFVSQKNNVTNVMRHISSLDVLMEVAKRLQPEQTEAEAIVMAQAIQSRLSVEIGEIQSTIIDLTYKDHSTTEAEQVLSLIIQVYNEKWLGNKHMITKSASRFIDARLKLLERDLDQVDDSISTYKSRYGITDLQHVSDIYLQQQSRSDAELLTLSNQKAMAEYIRDLLKDKSSQHQLLLVNSGINNRVIEDQITLYNSLVLDLQSHLEYTSDQNPLIATKEKELTNLRNSILANINNHIRTIDIQLLALEGYNGETTSKITSNPAQAKYLVSIEREQKVKESLYLYLLQKKEENELSSTYQAANTQIIDIPHGSGKPTSPQRGKVLVAAVMLGLLIPVTIIFLRASFDETVRNSKDITCHDSLLLFACIPLCPNINIWKQLQYRLHKKPIPRVGMVVAKGLQDPANEAFRVLRTKIENKTIGHSEGKVMMVTSFKQGEGKTFVSMNLALTLAIHHKHILFIDADMRQGTASKFFGADDWGLTDYLCGITQDATQSIIQLPDYPSLDILPVGVLQPTPTELLGTERFAKMIASLRKQYELVIIDTPQVDGLADTEILEQYADATLFITRAGLLRRQRLNELEEAQQKGKYKGLTVVVNGTENELQSI